jgi:hypothetical protein
VLNIRCTRHSTFISLGASPALVHAEECTEFYLRNADTDDGINVERITPDNKCFQGDACPAPGHFVGSPPVKFCRQTYQFSFDVGLSYCQASTKKVFLTLAGAISHSQTELAFPYALFGNSGSDYYGRPMKVGHYSIRSKAVDASGNVQEDITGYFEIVDCVCEVPIVYFKP